MDGHTVCLGPRLGNGQNPLSVGIIKQPKMGAFNQHKVVTAVCDKLNPLAIISIGVGWGNKQKLGKTAKEGDVMVSEMIVDFTDNAKVEKGWTMKNRSPTASASSLLFERFHSAGLPGKWNSFIRYRLFGCLVFPFEESSVILGYFVSPNKN